MLLDGLYCPRQYREYSNVNWSGGYRLSEGYLMSLASDSYPGRPMSA
jgi:hypothetical protein